MTIPDDTTAADEITRLTQGWDDDDTTPDDDALVLDSTSGLDNGLMG